jgi:hypothetical protein
MTATIRVTVVGADGARTGDVPSGSTVRDVLATAPAVRSAAASLGDDWLLSFSDLSAISVIGEVRIVAVSPPDPPSGAAAARFATAGLELGLRLNETVSRTAPATAREFWSQAFRNLRANVWKYFRVPIVALVAAYVVLSCLFYFAERHHQLHVAFGTAWYAVWLFMATIGFHGDSLSTWGEVLAVFASTLGIVGLGVLVALVFYSIQD